LAGGVPVSMQSNLSNLVSVVIPARNEVARIASVIDIVARQSNVDATIEIIVVDDGSTDNTADAATRAGAKVVRLEGGKVAGNPARARNIGARESRGDPIVFLDADCIPGQGWLSALLAAHTNHATIIGGALDLPPGLSPIARCDYYCGCYFIHSKRPAAFVPHHPPNNISVRRSAFMSTSGFAEHAPLNYTNEERHWQAELQRGNHRIYFEPAAIVYHYNRPGFGNLLRRSYRWGYTALEAKTETGSTRASWIFARPKLLLLLSPLIPFALSAHIVAAWARVGILEPILMTPIILMTRVAYVTGMVVGGLRWLRARNSHAPHGRPSPRWQ
jgi:glycosyltransferase involved in cell wall biosynthesis